MIYEAFGEVCAPWESLWFALQTDSQAKGGPSVGASEGVTGDSYSKLNLVLHLSSCFPPASLYSHIKRNCPSVGLGYPFMEIL